MEIEIKLRVASAAAARALLERAGALALTERRLEDNLLLDRALEPLAPTGRLLRLRSIGGTSVLTYKAPVPGIQRHKVRIEHETEVRDFQATFEIFAGLGFARVWRYQKYRTTFELGGVEVALDETPIGCFLELEGPAEAIDRAATRLGFDESSYVRASYRELHEAACGRSDVGDLVFSETSRER